MKTKISVALSMVLVLAALAAWTVFAQGPQPPETVRPTERLTAPEMLPPWEPEFGKPFGPRTPSARLAGEESGVGATAIPLGQPGLSFRYVQSFGETGVPYFADDEHLFEPSGVAVDQDGNLYVSEFLGFRLLKCTAAQNCTTIIGQAGQFWVGLAWPRHVDVDSDGNIWVVELCAHRVSKWASDGTFLTQLGETWVEGSDNEHFTEPHGVAVMTDTVYIADYWNHRIQIFHIDGLTTTTYITTLGVTGECGTGNDHFCNPAGVAADAEGRIYVADSENHRVQIFNPDFTYTATLGITGECGSSNAHFCRPRDVAIGPDGKIYVVDTDNGRVQVFNPYPDLSYRATLVPSDGFVGPQAIAVDAEGHIYVADSWSPHHRVVRFESIADTQGQTFAGTFGEPYLTDNYHYNEPEGIAVDDSGNIYLVEEHGRRLIKVAPDGTPVFAIGSPGNCDYDNGFCGPKGVAIGPDGYIYVADTWHQRVQIYSSDGIYSATLGTGYGTGDYEFDGVYDVALDAEGNIYVVDTFNHRVQIYDRHRNYKTTLGKTDDPGPGDDQFNEPHGVAVDKEGNIYVADSANHRVQIFDKDLNLIRTLGVTGEIGNNFDHFCWPEKVKVDNAGNIYVVESCNNRVQVFDRTGAYLTTIGGSWGDQTGQLRNPFGIALDRWGNVYIADSRNHRIQKFAPGVPGWKQVNINGFGDRWNAWISSLAVFNGRLYATGYQPYVWRLEPDGNWSAVSTLGFDDPTNVSIDAMAVFNNHLYVATLID